MRFRLMATYRGVPYEVGVGPSNSDVVLFAACPPPEELGFEPAPGHWRKHVIRAEVDVLWESRPVGSFHGDACLVLDDLGDRLHIAYLGKDGRRARELGYWQVDRGVYELLTPRDEVAGLTEEKAEQSLPRRGPVNGSQPMPSYPYGSPQRPPAPPASAGTPRDPRGRDGGAGYLSEPALAPAGAWNGDRPPAGTGSWNGNGAPADTGSWNRNGTPPGTGNWNRNGSPADTGGWNRDGSPADTGGWNRNGAPADTGGWNRNGAPASPGNWNGGGAPGTVAGAANGHGMASWNGMAGPDGILDAPAAPGPARRRQAPKTGRRSARKQRVPTRAIFSELADLAAIPRSAYALEQESDGAMCLLRTAEGFEVFSAADGVRHEVRSFDDEEAAYFYLFGVLAAEAVRNGSLIPPR
ncbi:MAG: hypothetical protein QOG05_5717 [Streptosporangiaceae bacterium]|jgi:hypothetical protein|nr:hypothetical protein [Streptosporangiaceae bacterium]